MVKLVCLLENYVSCNIVHITLSTPLKPLGLLCETNEIVLDVEFIRIVLIVRV